MKRHFTLALIILMLLLSLTVFGSPKITSHSEISKEEYAVYSAVIKKMFAGGKVTFDTRANVKLLVIADRNINLSRAMRSPKDDLDDLTRRLPSLTQEVIDNFIEKSTKLENLKDDFEVNFIHTFIKEEEFKETFKEWLKGWQDFYQKFPESGGYIGLSRVGFDAKNKLALVYMEHNCGDLCATGHFLLLKKSETGWEIIEASMPWIS